MLCVLAVAAALALVAADGTTRERVALGWADFLLYRVGSDGSRDLLGAISTSSLAVARTTFSITMAVLALTWNGPDQAQAWFGDLLGTTDPSSRSGSLHTTVTAFRWPPRTPR